MGLLLPSKRGIVVEDFILVRQEVSLASVSLDMDWWADKQIELFDKHGIEPWRTSCWCHTHPAGINRPSTTDEQTMEESFGGWDFILMLILTKAGQFYARMDFDHDFGTGVKQRLSVPYAVEIDWGHAGKEAISEETIQCWEEEFKQCVPEVPDRWLLVQEGPQERVRLRKGSWLPKPTTSEQIPGGNAGREEVEEYVQTCSDMGYDPSDPQNFEDYFGYNPDFGF